jgi:hypothetical protein
MSIIEIKFKILSMAVETSKYPNGRLDDTTFVQRLNEMSTYVFGEPAIIVEKMYKKEAV